MTRVLITGVTGQDGHLLAQALLREGVEVFGLARRADADVPQGTQVLLGDLIFHNAGVAILRKIQLARRRCPPSKDTVSRAVCAHAGADRMAVLFELTVCA